LNPTEFDSYTSGKVQYTLTSFLKVLYCSWWNFFLIYFCYLVAFFIERGKHIWYSFVYEKAFIYPKMFSTKMRTHDLRRFQFANLWHWILPLRIIKTFVQNKLLIQLTIMTIYVKGLLFFKQLFSSFKSSPKSFVSSTFYIYRHFEIKTVT
jgi:hypothetical protein